MARQSKAMTMVNHLTQRPGLTRRKQPAPAVRPAKEAAAAADRTASEFLTRLSEELRTPLYVILGYSELMTEGEFGALTAEQGQILERIRRNALELHGLISRMNNRALDIERPQRAQRRHRQKRRAGTWRPRGVIARASEW